MPVSTDAFALFVAAALAICVSPGPDMLYVLANGIHGGARAGVVSALGMAGGMVVHTAAAALGLAALLAASPLAFAVARYAGAAYLLFLGVRTLREPALVADVPAAGPSRLPAVFRRAMLTNLLNPKVALFYLAFLPQFVDARRGAVAPQFLLLGGTFVGLGLVVDAAVGVLGGSLRRALRRAGLSRALSWFAGLVLVGLAIRLAVAR